MSAVEATPRACCCDYGHYCCYRLHCYCWCSLLPCRSQAGRGPSVAYDPSCPVRPCRECLAHPRPLLGMAPWARAVKPPEFRLSVTALATEGSGGGWGAGYGYRTPLPAVRTLSPRISSLPAWSPHTQPVLGDPRQDRPSLSSTSGGRWHVPVLGLSPWSPTLNTWAQTPRLLSRTEPGSPSPLAPVPPLYSCGRPGDPPATPGSEPGCP